MQNKWYDAAILKKEKTELNTTMRDPETIRR
jgi:hypothetical protein